MRIILFFPYRNDPKFSDRYALANSIDPDQTASSLIMVYTVCHSVCIVWTHYSMVEPHSSNFRVITTKFLEYIKEIYGNSNMNFLRYLRLLALCKRDEMGIMKVKKFKTR